MTEQHEPRLALREHLREDEDFIPQTCPEAFLMERLAQARATIASATVSCDHDLERNCHDAAICSSCGHEVFVHMTEARRDA